MKGDRSGWSDASHLHSIIESSEVLSLRNVCSPQNASSADAHVALGVLYNLSRDFDGAVEAFRVALQTRSSDYSLWNKLGATLANSGRSSEAIDAYQRALELKPNYMRAWVNMGISQVSCSCTTWIDGGEGGGRGIRQIGMNLSINCCILIIRFHASDP